MNDYRIPITLLSVLCLLTALPKVSTTQSSSRGRGGGGTDPLLSKTVQRACCPFAVYAERHSRGCGLRLPGCGSGEDRQLLPAVLHFGKQAQIHTSPLLPVALITAQRWTLVLS